MSPEDALKIRDKIVSGCAEGIALTQRGAHFELQEAAEKKNIYPGLEAAVFGAIPLASVTIWRKQLWDAAQSGRHALVGLPVDESWKSIGDQIWLFEAPIEQSLLGNPPADANFLGYLLTHANAVFVYEIWNLNNNISFNSVPSIDTFDGLIETQSCHIAAGLKFIDLEFVGRERQTLPRSIRRAAALERRPALPEINIIQLRRAAHADKLDSGTDQGCREWSCQWLVSGHWRKQWYPKTAEWKPKYIAPHVKGNPDKPLRKPKGTVYVVNR